MRVMTNASPQPPFVSSTLSTASSTASAQEPGPTLPTDSLALGPPMIAGADAVAASPDAMASSAATAASRPRLSERLGAVVDARLALLPEWVAAAITLCERVSANTLGSETTGQVALEAVRHLRDEVTAGVLSDITVQDEIEESRAFASGFLLPIDNPPTQVARAQAVLERIENATPAALRSRVNVLNGGGFDAFGKGGENIYVTDDIVNLPDDALAATLGHERVHLLQRHQLQALVMGRLGRALEARASEAARPSVKRVALLAQAEQRRQQELEADAGSAAMLAAAGYDPNALVDLLAGSASGAETSTPLDEYPTNQERIAALRLPA